MNLYREITAGFQHRPQKPLLIVGNNSSWSFADIEHLAAVLAARMHEYGVRVPQRVLVQVEKSPFAVALYLACLRLGLVFVPLNTAYTDEEVRYFAHDAAPSLAILDPARAPALRTVIDSQIETLDGHGTGTLTRALDTIAPLPVMVERRGTDLAALIYTSGTTGRSKGAMLSNDNLLSNARALLDCWQWQDDDVLLHALPMFHVHGLFVALHSALLGGSSMLFLASFSAAEVCKMLPHATVMMGVPTYYTRLLALEQFDRSVCQNMRLFISGSAPLLETTFARFHARSGHRILERYGMSETNMIASNPYDGERVPGTVGFALAGVSIRIASAEGASNNTAGEVQVRGPNVFSGYWRRPDLTDSVFTRDGFFRTGDLGHLDDSGRLTLSGRAKDLIISGGLNVYPREVELHVDAVPGVVESAVVGVTDADFGERVVAFVVAPGKDARFIATLERHLATRLAPFKRPKRYYLVNELPKNTMGKVQKNRLRRSL